MSKYKATADFIATQNGCIEYEEADRFTYGESVEIVESARWPGHFEIERDGCLVGLSSDDIERWFEEAE